MNSLLSGVGTARKGAQRGDDSDANSGDEGGGRGKASYKNILVGGGGLLRAQDKGKESRNKRGEREGSGRCHGRAVQNCYSLRCIRIETLNRRKVHWECLAGSHSTVGDTFWQDAGVRFPMSGIYFQY